MRIIRTARYSRDLRKLKVSAADIQRLERTIAARPDSGAIIQGLKGVRKARFRIGNRGKSGGGRAIYYVMVTKSAILMITAYAKADKEDISQDDRKAILRSLEEFGI